MSGKLVGYRMSPTVQEVLFTIELAKAPITLENVDWEDAAKRKELVKKTPTGTFPYLEVEQGVISESKAIEEFVAETYSPALLGANAFEKAQVKQWINFATSEIYGCSKNIIYPLFGWGKHDKEAAAKSNKSLMEHMKVLDAHLNGKKYLVGATATLADIVMFNTLRFYFQLVFVEGMRKNVLKNVTAWFSDLMATPEAVKVYGRTLLAKVALKPYVAPEKKEEKKEEKKKEEKKDTPAEEPKKKKVNPLDELPPSTLELEKFKREFLNNKDKKDAMQKFWEQYDPKGYSIWWMEYQKLPSEGKVLFRTSNSKSFFLQKLDSFRKYCFAVHGVYGSEGDYEVRGVWMWRGTEIPAEIKEHDNFEYMTIKKLDPSKPEDKQLVEDYWTKLNETDEVEGRKCADVEYFN